MPKLTDSIPKYRKHRASGQALVTLSGKDLYLGPYGSLASRANYDRLIGEWLAAGRHPATVAVSDLTIVELCSRYWQHASGYYVPGGSLASIKRMLKALKWRYGATAAVDFGPLALKAVREQFVAEGLSRTYCNHLTDLVRRMFKWGASEQLLPVSTWQALTTVTGLRRGHTAAPENEPVTAVADEVVEATIPYLSTTVASMVRLQRLSGMRPAEICRLRPCEVDRSELIWAYRPGHHKTSHTGRARVVLIGPKGQDVLRPFLLRDAETFCFVPSEVVGRQRQQRHAARTTPLSCGNVPGSNRIRRAPRRSAGDRYEVASYRRAIHRACDQAFPPPEDLPAEDIKSWRSRHRWSPNRLRHRAATDIRKRFGLEAAQVALGHSKADVTQIYAQRDLTLGAKVMAEVG